MKYLFLLLMRTIVLVCAEKGLCLDRNEIGNSASHGNFMKHYGYIPKDQVCTFSLNLIFIDNGRDCLNWAALEKYGLFYLKCPNLKMLDCMNGISTIHNSLASYSISDATKDKSTAEPDKKLMFDEKLNEISDNQIIASYLGGSKPAAKRRFEYYSKPSSVIDSNFMKNEGPEIRKEELPMDQNVFHHSQAGDEEESVRPIEIKPTELSLLSNKEFTTSEKIRGSKPVAEMKFEGYSKQSSVIDSNFMKREGPEISEEQLSMDQNVFDHPQPGDDKETVRPKEIKQTSSKNEFTNGEILFVLILVFVLIYARSNDEEREFREARNYRRRRNYRR